MWPYDLEEIYKRLHNLNPDFGFAPNSRPYIYQEVIYDGHGPIKHSEYIPLGDVTEFRVSHFDNFAKKLYSFKWRNIQLRVK